MVLLLNCNCCIAIRELRVEFINTAGDSSLCKHNASLSWSELCTKTERKQKLDQNFLAGPRAGRLESTSSDLSQARSIKAHFHCLELHNKEMEVRSSRDNAPVIYIAVPCKLKRIFQTVSACVVGDVLTLLRTKKAEKNLGQ